MEEDFQLAKPIIRNIAFFGDSSVSESDPVYKDALATAKLLAENGYVIVNGGGPGVMNAATQGAVAGKGETISVTFYPKDATGFEGRYVGNVTNIEIKTTNYIDRMFKLMEHGDMFVIFKGGTGTISELGTAWVLAKLYYGHHKPFILYGEFWHRVISAVKRSMSLSREELDVFDIVKKPAEVLKVIQEFEAKLRRHDHAKCKFCRGKECAFIK